MDKYSQPACYTSASFSRHAIFFKKNGQHYKNNEK